MGLVAWSAVKFKLGLVVSQQCGLERVCGGQVGSGLGYWKCAALAGFVV